MELRAEGSSGFVADGYWRCTRSEEFRARKRALRETINAAFDPKLAAANGWIAQWWIRWDRFHALSRELWCLYPSPYSCYSHATSASKGKSPSGAK